MAIPGGGVTITSLTNALKVTYGNWMTKCFSTEYLPLKRLTGKSDNSEIGALGLTFSVQPGRTGSARAGAETAALPAPGVASYKQVTQTLAMQVGTALWTERILKLADNDIKSFAKQAQSQMEDLKDAMVASLARQIMGTGDGIITTLRAVSDGTSASTTNKLYVTDARMFEIGMRLDVVQGASYTTRLTAGSYLKVSFVDYVNNVVEWSANDEAVDAVTASTAIGDYVIIYGSHSSGTTYETVGMQQICSDTSTLHGLSPSTAATKWWRANVRDNGGGVNEPLALENLDALLHDIQSRGGKASVMYMSLGVKRALLKLIRTQRQFVDAVKVDPGMEVDAYTADVGKIPMIADRWVAPNTIFVLDESKVFYKNVGPLRFLDRSGSMFHLYSDSGGIYPAWFSAVQQDCQLFCKARMFQGKLRYIEEA